MRFAFLMALMYATVVTTFLHADEPAKPSLTEKELDNLYYKIDREYHNEQQEIYQTASEAKTPEERRKLNRKVDPQPYIERFLELHKDHPDSRAGATALHWIILKGTNEQVLAAAESLKVWLTPARDLGQIKSIFTSFWFDAPAGPMLAPKVYEQVQRDPKHSRTAELLIWVSACKRGSDDADIIKLSKQAGDELVEHHLDAKYMWLFC